MNVYYYNMTYDMYHVCTHVKARILLVSPENNPPMPLQFIRAFMLIHVVVLQGILH